MKTIALIAISLSVAATLLVPFAFELAASIMFATGVVGIAIFDYARPARSLRLPLGTPDMVPVNVIRRERFGLAA